MSDFRLWMGLLSRPDIQCLPHDQRDALFALAATVADLESEPDGLLPAAALYRVPWTAGPQELEILIGELCKAGLLERFDEPAGWLFPGWTDPVGYYRHAAPLAWGQRTVDRIRTSRDFNKKRAASARQRKRPAQNDDGLPNADPGDLRPHGRTPR